MIGYDALRAEQAAARGRGPAARASGSGCTSSRRAWRWATWRARAPIVQHRRQRPGAGADEQRQPRPEPGDDDRPGRRRPPRRRRRRRHASSRATRRRRRSGRAPAAAAARSSSAAPPTRPPTAVRAKVLEIAAHHLEAAPRGPRDRGRRGSPSSARRRRATSITEVARLAYLNPAGLPPGMEMGLEEKARYTPNAPFTWSNSCHACLCEVDPRTGEVTLLRYVVSEDCGVMINPDVVEGQIAGGVVQGIGGVLYEHMVYDDAGNPLTHDVRRLPAADGGRGADHRVRPHRDAGARRTPAATRGWGRAAPSARRRRSSTPSPTPSPTSAPA